MENEVLYFKCHFANVSSSILYILQLIAWLSQFYCQAFILFLHFHQADIKPTEKCEGSAVEK